MNPIILRRLLLAPPGLRSSLHATRQFSLQLLGNQTIRPASNIPSIAQASFWKEIIPKPFRRSGDSQSKKKPKSKEWNPAVFYIVIFLLIGSMSIQMIALRNEHAVFTRRADAKLGLLKEIIGRVQRGEEVDVEGLLGTGDSEREQEWEEVLKDIEREDELWKESKTRKPRPATVDGERSAGGERLTRAKAESEAPPGFY